MIKYYYMESHNLKVMETYNISWEDWLDFVHKMEPQPESGSDEDILKALMEWFKNEDLDASLKDGEKEVRADVRIYKVINGGTIYVTVGDFTVKAKETLIFSGDRLHENK